MKYLFTFLVFVPFLCLGQNNYVVNIPNSTTPATNNTLVGPDAGNTAMTGESNSFIGASAGKNNTTGYNNLFIGSLAGTSNSTGWLNVFVGSGAGSANDTGVQNSFVGAQAGAANTIGFQNSFMGAYAGRSNTIGVNNSFLGAFTGFYTTTGRDNSFLGALTGQKNTTGSFNLFMGSLAGYTNTTGASNTFLGYQSGYNNTTGSNNIIIGPNSGTAITTSDDNVLMGYNSQADDGLYNAIAIGSNSRVAVSNALILGNRVNVGIGTSKPKSKLEVTADESDNSGLRLTKLTQTSPAYHSTDQFLTVNDKGDVVKARYQLRINHPNEWSDKVFSPTYQRRSLSSIESYVKQQGHLPGIPSAEQVVKDGVDLVKMNATLLEKVEELTLYSIDLEKAINTEKQMRQQVQEITQQQQARIEQLERLMKQLIEKK